MTTALLAEALYEHWCSSSYELKREPAFADAAPNLQRVFTDQAAALEQVIESTMRQAVADAFISAAHGARFRGDIGKEGGQDAAGYLELCARYALVDDWDEFFEAPREASPDTRVADIPESTGLKLFIGPTGYSHLAMERDARQAIASADALLAQATAEATK